MSEILHDQLVRALARSNRSEAWTHLQQMTPAPPRFFYKYLPTGSPGIRSVIVDSQLWLASPRTLNDPFEMAINVTFKGKPAEKLKALQDLAKRMGETGRRAQAFAKATYQGDPAALMNETHRKQIDRFGVTSLSAAGARNLLMWAHYGEWHRGVCFQFHLPSTPLQLFEAFPVSYSDEYPVINWLRHRKVETQLGTALYQKSRDWAYEREFRMVERERANTLYNLRPQGVSGLILGVNATVEFVDSVKKLLKVRESSRLPRIKVFRSKVHSSQYRLVIGRAREIESECYS